MENSLLWVSLKTGLQCKSTIPVINVLPWESLAWKFFFPVAHFISVCPVSTATTNSAFLPFSVAIPNKITLSFYLTAFPRGVSSPQAKDYYPLLIPLPPAGTHNVPGAFVPMSGNSIMGIDHRSPRDHTLSVYFSQKIKSSQADHWRFIQLRVCSSWSLFSHKGIFTVVTHPQGPNSGQECCRLKESQEKSKTSSWRLSWDQGL